MLQNIRDRFTGGFALAILALLCVPFVFFGINYDFIGSSYAAKVNGEEISLAEFQNAYQQQLMQYAESGTEVPEQLRSAIRAGVLNRLVGERLVDQYLASAGYRIGDQMVTDVIQRQPDFRVDGRFSKENYYSWLSERGQTPASFEAFQRYQLRQSQLRRGVAATAFVTPAEFRRFLNLYGEQRDVSMAVFDVQAVAETIDVVDEDIQDYYDERPAEFQSSESVDLAFIELRRDELRQQVQVSDEELQQHYEDSRNRYMQDEQRRASHILIPFGDDEDAAREQAAAFTERVRAGEPLADLARQYSADGGSAERGGDLGLSVQSQLDPAVGEAVFSMREGDVRGPVRSEYGFHVIRLEEVADGGPLPLEQVRAELERELRDRKVDEAWRNLEGNVSDLLFDAGDIDSIAAELDLDTKTATGFTRAGGADFGDNQAAIDAIFDPSVLNEGRVSDIIDLDANRSIVVQVKEYHEAARLPLDEVRDDIVRAIKMDRAREQVSNNSDALQAAVRGGDEFAAAAEAAGASEVTTTTLDRQGSGNDPAVSAAVFELDKPSDDAPRVGSTQTRSGDQVVFRLTAVRPGRPEAIPIEERDQGKNNLAAQAGNADYAAVVRELERRADVVRNQDALAQQNLFE